MDNYNETLMHKKSRFTWRRILGIIVVVLLILVVVAGWWVKRHIYASPFQPTQLSTEEQQQLNTKLSQLEQAARQGELSANAPSPDSNGELQPEPYSEEESQRAIRLSEKEINALIARESEFARRMVVDLAEDLVSVKFLVPLDQDFPIIGGTTLRVNFGVTLRYENGKPVVIIRGVSLGGVPLPGAWWGDIKNKNLVQEFGGEGGFWDQLSKGIEDLSVRDGELWLKLKE